MVSEERIEGATGLTRFDFEACEQIKDGTFLIAAVKLITDLDNNEAAANPPQLIIDCPGEFKRVNGHCVITMDIPEGYDASSTRPPGRLLRQLSVIMQEGAVGRATRSAALS